MAGEDLGLTSSEQSFLTRKAILDHMIEQGLPKIVSDDAQVEAILEFAEPLVSSESLGKTEEAIARFAEKNELIYFEAARQVATVALSKQEWIPVVTQLGYSRLEAVLILAQSELDRSKGEQ